MLKLPSLGPADFGLPAFARWSTSEEDKDAFRVSLVVYAVDAASAEQQTTPHLKIWLQVFGLGNMPYDTTTEQGAPTRGGENPC
jgi:hypothetical protein